MTLLKVPDTPRSRRASRTSRGTLQAHGTESREPVAPAAFHSCDPPCQPHCVLVPQRTCYAALSVLCGGLTGVLMSVGVRLSAPIRQGPRRTWARPSLLQCARVPVHGTACVPLQLTIPLTRVSCGCACVPSRLYSNCRITSRVAVDVGGLAQRCTVRKRDLRAS